MQFSSELRKKNNKKEEIDKFKYNSCRNETTKQAIKLMKMTHTLNMRIKRLLSK